MVVLPEVKAQIRLSPNNNSSSDPLLYLSAGPVGSEKCVSISSRYDYHLGSGAIRIDYTSTSYLTIDHEQNF